MPSPIWSKEINNILIPSTTHSRLTEPLSESMFVHWQIKCWWKQASHRSSHTVPYEVARSCPLTWGFDMSACCFSTANSHYCFLIAALHKLLLWLKICLINTTGSKVLLKHVSLTAFLPQKLWWRMDTFQTFKVHANVVPQLPCVKIAKDPER